MKYLYPGFIFFIVVFMSVSTAGQSKQQVPDSLPAAKTYNAGFDVIILYNGEILYGLVKEVGLTLVKYQRTDIPDGPIYTIPRNEISAISYRNQVKEYMNPVIVHPREQIQPDLINKINRWDTFFNKNRVLLFTENNLRIGIGFIRGYSKVPDAGDYAKEGGSPVVSLAYDTRFSPGLRVGVQMAFGSQKFSKQEYSAYDSIQTASSLKENIFTITLYGKYTSKITYARFKPYVVIGLGVNTSNIRTESELSLTNSQSLFVTTGTRSAGVGILARVGADYFFENNYGLYADIGSGASLVQIGAIINLN